MNFDDLVSKIKADMGLQKEVPGFDPNNGNENARFLFLLEAPGPKAVKSGVISFDNPDPSARNIKHQLEQAGIDRGEIALWNIVPWYIGNDDNTAIRAASRKDVDMGMQYLADLIAAMPRLECIVLVGSAARTAHLYLSQTTRVRIVTCHHTSARVLNSRPVAEQENIEVFKRL